MHVYPACQCNHHIYSPIGSTTRPRATPHTRNYTYHPLPKKQQQEGRGKDQMPPQVMEATMQPSMAPPPPKQDATIADMSCTPANAMAGGGGGAGRERCPRCASHDTKFCYYNNYNTAQPRHFCRACRRYWTLGGSLRNVPIGGSTRKRPRPPRPARVAAAGHFTSPPAPAPAGLLSSLLLPLGAPLLEGRLGFDLGLGLPEPAADEMGLGFGLRGAGGQLLWPGAYVEHDAWKVDGPAATAAMWQELAGGGGLHHGGQLL